jgi:hypothetical protein
MAISKDAGSAELPNDQAVKYKLIGHGHLGYTKGKEMPSR